MLNSIKELKKSISELSVYDMNIYSAIELYYTVANKLNDVINNVNEFETGIDDNVMKLNNQIQYLLNEGLNEELVKIINEMLENGILESIINHLVYEDIKTYRINSSMTTSDVQEILDKAKNGKSIELLFNDNTTYSYDKLYINSNTTLSFGNNTIIKPKTKGNMLFANIKPSDTDVLQYNGNGNILIRGGIIKDSTAIMFVHGQNITIDSVTFEECITHSIQIASCKNVEIKNCNFINQYDSSRDYVESIQIDACTYDSLDKSIPQGSATYDNCPNEIITVKNCSFIPKSYLNNSGNKMICGVGSHTKNLLPHKNISIENNTFEGCIRSGIGVCGWENVIIKNNVFKNCVKSIDANTWNEVDYNNNNITIENNVFVNSTEKTIDMTSKSSNNDYQSIKLINNIFDNCSKDILYIKRANIDIKDNVFKSCDSATTVINLSEFSTNIINNSCTGAVRFIRAENGNINIANNDISNLTGAFSLIPSPKGDVIIKNNIIRDSSLANEYVISISNLSRFFIENNKFINITGAANKLILTTAKDVVDGSIYTDNKLLNCPKLVELNSLIENFNPIVDNPYFSKIFATLWTGNSNGHSTISLSDYIERYSFLYIVTGATSNGSYIPTPVIPYGLKFNLSDTIKYKTFSGDNILTISGAKELTINTMADEIRAIYGILK